MTDLTLYFKYVSSVFALFLLLAIWLFYAYQNRIRISYRLNGIAASGAKVKGIHALLNAVGKRLSQLSGFGKGNNDKDERNQLLWQAGFRSDYAFELYNFARLLSFVILGGVGLLANLDPAVLAVLAIAGYFIPKYVVNYRVKRRKQKIEKDLPYAIDMMVVLIEAGLGLESALRRVSDELSRKGQLLGVEMNYLCLELASGVQKEIAYRNFGVRCGVDGIFSLVGMLIQTDKFGVSLAKSLRVQAAYTRKKRKQMIEEKINKLPVKLAGILFAFYFPVIVIVTAGPAVLSLFRFFSSGIGLGGLGGGVPMR